MENKEVIDKLQAYFLEQDHELIARMAAALLVDLHRMATFGLLPEDERQSLVERVRKNSIELEAFIKKGPSSGLELINVNEDVS